MPDPLSVESHLTNYAVCETFVCLCVHIFVVDENSFKMQRMVLFVTSLMCCLFADACKPALLPVLQQKYPVNSTLLSNRQSVLYPFSALILLVGHRKGTCKKKLGVGLLMVTF